MLNTRYLHNLSHDIITDLSAFSKIMNMEKKKILYLVLDNLSPANLNEFCFSSGHYIHDLALYKDFWIRAGIIHKLQTDSTSIIINTRATFNRYYNLNKYKRYLNNNYSLSSLNEVTLHATDIDCKRECNTFLLSILSNNPKNIAIILFNNLAEKINSDTRDVYVLYHSLMALFTQITDPFIVNYKCYQDFCLAKIKKPMELNYNNPIEVFNTFTMNEFKYVGI